jgi:membrane-associated phospholipid phosphatase
VAHVHAPLDILAALAIAALGGAAGLWLGGRAWDRWQSRADDGPAALR